MSQHRRPDNDEGEPYVPSVADVVARWRYTLSPTLYTDETSGTDEQLHQQVLEARAIRAWLVVIAITLGLALVTSVVFTFALVAGAGGGS